MSAVLKENFDMKEIIFRLIKGKQGLDQVLSILVNFQKEGLGYTLNQKNVPKTKNSISFVKATNSPSTSQHTFHFSLTPLPLVVCTMFAMLHTPRVISETKFVKVCGV